MIDALVTYSSNDYRFFPVCIKNLLDAGLRVNVVSCTSMWNGTPENQQKLDASDVMFADHPMYNSYQLQWEAGRAPWYWDAMMKHQVVQSLPSDSEFVLIIDVDEIVETDKLIDFLASGVYKPYPSVKLGNYWYFREPIYRATQTENSVILVNTEHARNVSFDSNSLSNLHGGHQHGRDRYKLTNISMFDHDPFIHHYSWVRTQTEMLNKVKNWGHSHEKDWTSLVNEEFSRPFNGTDFVHGYAYQTVPNTFNIKMGDI